MQSRGRRAAPPWEGVPRDYPPNRSSTRRQTLGPPYTPRQMADGVSGSAPQGPARRAVEVVDASGKGEGNGKARSCRKQGRSSREEEPEGVKNGGRSSRLKTTNPPQHDTAPETNEQRGEGGRQSPTPSQHQWTEGARTG